MIGINTNMVEQVVLMLHRFLLRDDLTDEERQLAKEALADEQRVLRREAFFAKVRRTYQH